MFVKICGITRKEDLETVVAVKASAIGFIAYPKSPRYVSPETVKSLLSSPLDILKAGVFVNAAVEEISAYLDAGINVIQLHGEETPEFINTVNQLPGVKEVWNAIRPRNQEEILAGVDLAVDKFLIDTFSDSAPGGTGKVANWDLAAFAIKELPKPVILAGGLNPDNISEAINRVAPFGVDVSTGVETSPGIKNSDLIHQFINNINN